MKILKRSIFKKDGEEVFQYSLKNYNNIEIKILNLGGIITDILIPDKYGTVENIVVKWKNLKDYINDNSYSGAIIGRTTGRIAGGYIDIYEKRYELTKNQGINTLHGGIHGFNSKTWKGTIFESEKEVGVILEAKSKDGEDGFPGNIDIKVKYTLNDKDEFSIKYYGKSDKGTLINMTNHSYFNLSGNLKRNILDEVLMIKSKSMATIREDSAPSGEIINILGTAFDFSRPKKVGDDINNNHEQLILGCGYDHPWVLSDKEGQIVLKDEVSGRILEISTDREAVVVYSTNFPESSKELEWGGNLEKHGAICFETQNLPIGPKGRFIENSLIKKDEEYKAKTIFKFRVDKDNEF